MKNPPNIEDSSTAPEVAWVVASVCDVRNEPAHAAEQVTQGLQGERVQVLEERDGWLQSRLPDGYRGWIRDWHLQRVPETVPARFQARADARVCEALVVVRSVPNGQAAPVAESIWGTAIVRGEHRDGWCQVELPGGRHGWLPEDALRPGLDPWPSKVDALLQTLQCFIGVPYVWGGKSPKGFDCSGLLQFACGLHGVPLPRDSADQFTCGDPVDGDLRAGDLVFFGAPRVGHVGIIVSGTRFLHARGEVRYNDLSPDCRDHDPHLAAQYRGARRLAALA